MKTINRIILFGDSFVEGQGTYETITNDGTFTEPVGFDRQQLRTWRKENSWNKFLKEITDCEIINHAAQGCDNYLQFNILNDYLLNPRETDLLLFGFTSKLRDRLVNFAFTQYNHFDNPPLLHPRNALHNQIGWEKLSLEIEKFGFGLDGADEYRNRKEKKFTEEYIQDFYVKVFDEIVYEKISQANYLFYQKWCKENGINIIFFDLFEKYVDDAYLNEFYEVDKEMYISYQNKSFVDVLQEYEINHVKDEDVGVWEWGHKRPDLQGIIYHGNQHGYKVYIDWLYETHLKNKYKFESSTL